MAAELLAWRQGMHGPALVTSLPAAARGAAVSGAVLAAQRLAPTVRPSQPEACTGTGWPIPTRMVEWP
jgi:hypothetical protein